MADSCKTAGLELRVACRKKHPLDKCESIMEKPLNDQNIKQRKTLLWISKTYGYRS